MKSFDSRTYSINDFVEWDEQGSLVLNPSFQRRPVWSDKAKSYLMDTILRGKPIPKVFIRQKINVTTKSSQREIVDGQQRIRTILSFIKDGFSVTPKMHSEYGGKLFSQLDVDVQAQVLSYEIAVDLLINMPDAEVLDIFGRLNSYAVILNEQEKLHANHFGPFKVTAEEIAHRYTEYWRKQKIFSDREILRMKEVNLVADLMIAMMEGIKTKKRISAAYKVYEKNVEAVPEGLSERFDAVISTIGKLFPDGLAETEFTRPFLFYTLFTAVYHCIFGLKDFGAATVSLNTPSEIEQVKNRLDRVGELFQVDIQSVDELTRSEQQFLTDSRRATTDMEPRMRRTQFIIELIK